MKKEIFLTASQVKAFDNAAKVDFGLETIVLMENAGRAVAEELLEIPGKKAYIFFCGKGNNGGDGFVAIRHLLAYGIKPVVISAVPFDQVKDEAARNLNVLIKLGQRITVADKKILKTLRKKITSASVIIDAILGVGITGEVKGMYRECVDFINSSGAYVVSVDIPSGLDATTGKICGVCVKADRTVTFVAKKKGMDSPEGRKASGEVIVRGIGVPLGRLML